MPRLYVIGRVAEEFHCTLSEAAREYARLPIGTLEDLMLMRAYARIHAQFAAGIEEPKITGDPTLVTWCGDVIGQANRALLEERKRKYGGP